MFTKTASAFALVALCSLARAQGDQKVDDNTFYKAFYLDRGEKKYDAAEPLYRKFLTAHADSNLAPMAARNLVQLLHRVGKSDDANALSQQYSALIKAAPKETPDQPANPPQPGEGGGRRGQGAGGMGGRGGNFDPEARAKELEGLKKDLEAAKTAGDQKKVDELTQRITRLENAGRRGQGGQGGRGGFQMGPPKPLAEMSDTEREEWLTQIKERTTNMANMMRDRGNDEAADRIEEALKKYEGLVKEKKYAEAEEAMRAMMPTRGRRGGGGGGEGGPGAGPAGGGRQGGGATGGGEGGEKKKEEPKK